MKKINVTFSIPEETHRLLQGLVSRRKLSSFVTTVLNKALEEKVEILKQAYIEAQSDLDRKEVIADWSTIEGKD